MRMKKTIKISFAVLLSAGVLVACNKPEWLVKYQDEDPYNSISYVATVDVAGNSIIGGTVDARPETGGQRSAFVAKYNRSGQLIWDRRFEENSTGIPTSGVRGLLSDARGNVYVAEPRMPADASNLGLLVTKFNAAGEQLWQYFDSEANLLNLKLSMYFDESGNLYVRGGWGNQGQLVSLSAAGAFRWRAPVDDGSGIGDIELPPFPDAAPMLQSSTNNAGFDWVMTGTGIRILDRQANPLADFTFAALGLSKISHVEILGINLMLIGERADSTQRVARLIRRTAVGFVFDNTKSLDLSTVFPNVSGQQISSMAEQGICFASSNSENLLTTGYIDSELNLVWSNTHPTVDHGKNPDIMTVVGEAQACYTQYVESQDVERIVSTVLIERIADGSQQGPLSLEHFFATDLAVRGKEVFQTGLMGSYSGEDGTAATLSKQTIQ